MGVNGILAVKGFGVHLRFSLGMQRDWDRHRHTGVHIQIRVGWRGRAADVRPHRRGVHRTRLHQNPVPITERSLCSSRSKFR